MSELILKEIQERNIERLCHFTKSSKLMHILSSEDGILSNEFFKDLDEVLNKNDKMRYDGKEDYVCCSVQYTNSWYLDKIKDKDSLFKEWVVLFINPELMLNSSTFFCHRNAASNYGRNLRNGYEGFSAMFKDTVQGQYPIRRTNSMLSNCTTDGQAEVLIYKNIPRSYITGIAVPNQEQANRELIRFGLLDVPQIPIYIAPDLFSNSWSSMVKNGRRPVENLFEGELI
ncbi:DarT ssDNA thymidine ADP-ribosyltransferase family protein [Lysinibacillus sp. NPDC094403]|uniref:DarT ssDNA thymidine ADP-ribosyltransferase family protein n=1 Tax=Lysinibacillus sp. NPDC094403 TaxID=3390581 RepID=UPI003D065B9D